MLEPLCNGTSEHMCSLVVKAEMTFNMQCWVAAGSVTVCGNLHCGCCYT